MAKKKTIKKSLSKAQRIKAAERALTAANKAVEKAQKVQAKAKERFEKLVPPAATEPGD